MIMCHTHQSNAHIKNRYMMHETLIYVFVDKLRYHFTAVLIGLYAVPFLSDVRTYNIHAIRAHSAQ